MMNDLVLTGARLFDGERFHGDKAVVIRDGRIAAIVPGGEIDESASKTDLRGGILAPGFIDAQVNGGGGIMLNDAPTTQTMEVIAAAHRFFGTTSVLPTLITDRQRVTEQAIEAAISAVRADVGVAGLHLEGPHLSPVRKGVHLPSADFGLTGHRFR